MNLLSQMTPWWMRSEDVDQLRAQIVSLKRDLADVQQKLATAYAVLEREQVENRRAVDAARREAFPAAGPSGYPTGAAREIGLLKRALRGAHDQLAAAEDRPVHGEKYAKWGAR